MARFNVNKVERAKEQLAGGLEPIDWIKEPLTDPKDFRWNRYYNWINYNFNHVEQYKFVIQYMKITGWDQEHIERLKLLGPDNYTWAVTGAIARLLMQDIKVPIAQENFMRARINEAIAKAPMAHFNREGKVKISVQDRIRLQAWEWIGDIEAEVDKFNAKGKSDFNLIDWLTEKKVEKHFILHIQRHYVKQFNEMVDAYEGIDSYAAECYSPLAREIIKDRMIFTKRLIDEAGEYSRGIKVVRVRRNKKNKTKIRKKRK